MVWYCGVDAWQQMSLRRIDSILRYEIVSCDEKVEKWNAGECNRMHAVQVGRVSFFGRAVQGEL